jgi:small conductance mechanosensitive channel
VELTNVHGENIAGTVTALSVRIMKLQKQDGSLAFVPSGNIAHITNFSRTSQVVTVAVDVPLTEDVRGVSQALQAMAVGLYTDLNIQHLLVSAPKLQAVQALSDKGYSVRILAAVKPGNQWSVGRYIRLQAIQLLQDLQVEAPRVYVNLTAISPPSSASTSLGVENESKMSNPAPAKPTLPARPISPAESAELAGLPKMTVVL